MEPDSSEDNLDPCAICGMTTINEIEYGKFLSRPKKNLTVHHFCLMFSRDLVQDGATDDVGIAGFRIRIIKKFIAENVDICCYCGLKGASLYCANDDCNRAFHLICGMKNRCHLEFCGIYRTFCEEHGHKDKRGYSEATTGCPLCLHYCDKFEPSTICSSCSKCQIGFFHMRCIKRYALNAGYDFSCPLCKNKGYRDEVALLGVYVPNRMATWETPTLVASTQFDFTCEAKHCKAPGGRTCNTNEHPMFICLLCGQFGMHKVCFPENVTPNEHFVCSSCTDNQNRIQLSDHISLRQNELFDDDHNSNKLQSDADDLLLGFDTNDDVICIEPDVETITLSSGPITIPAAFLDKYRKIRLQKWLNEEIDDDPLEPWKNDEDAAYLMDE